MKGIIPVSNKFVQNNESGPTVFSTDGKVSNYIEWDGKGSPTGNDVQAVSEEVFNTPAFQKMIRRGLFTEVTGEDAIEDSQERQRQEWESRRDAAQRDSASAIDRQANNDMVTMHCVGPNVKGGKCGEDVLVREQKANDKPPLCPQHESLASEFIPEYGSEALDQSVSWTRVKMGERVKQA